MTDTANGVTYPSSLTASNNPPADMQVLALSVDAVYGKKVANAAALPAAGAFPGQRIWLDDIDESAYWDDTAAAWQGYTKPYVPTLVGVTGAATANYVVNGDWIDMDYTITFTGAATTTVTMTIPFAAALAAAKFPSVGQASLFDVSAGTFRLATVSLQTSTVVWFTYDQSNTTTNVSSGVQPFTWATGDTIVGTLRYRRA